MRIFWFVVLVVYVKMGGRELLAGEEEKTTAAHTVESNSMKPTKKAHQGRKKDRHNF